MKTVWSIQGLRRTPNSKSLSQTENDPILSKMKTLLSTSLLTPPLILAKTKD